ncbi:MAG TPA: hypothetical protein H9671_08275 [Firmicutes bacterium]|nr:hypothetical protein [Bacillota bacterium]
MSSMQSASTCFVHELNQNAKNDLQGWVASCEQRYRQQVLAAVHEIVSNTGKDRIVLMAGPSSSGKTTTAQILREELKDRGVDSVTVSLDDFYLPPDCFPVLPNGKYDYDAVECLDLPRLRACFSELIIENRTVVPRFDFCQVRQVGEREIVVDDDTVVIAEGIHALNPRLISPDLADRFFRIYISTQTDFVDQGEVVLSARDLRLLRRMLRDYYHRNSSFNNTLDMWGSVCAGEDKNIRPFMHEADFLIDSTHQYEPLLYHQSLFPLLVDTKWENSVHREKAERLQKALIQFGYLPEDIVPKNSLIREFLRDFH